MRNRDTWQPSKFVYRKGKLVASRDRKEVGVASRLAVDVTAESFDSSLRQHARGRLLDLGCGKAPLYHAYREYVSEIVCVDWEHSAHAKAYVDFECDLTQVLPFDNGGFDTIILSDVLEHIPEPDHLWREISRILAVDGKIIASIPFYYGIHESPHDYYRYTEFALRRFVEDSGLRMIHLDTLGGTPEILADILAKHVQFIPLLGPGLAITIQSVTGFFVGTGVGRKVSKRTGRGFPWGYFLIAEKPG